ncbi:MAG TPA: hypothetical protein VG455_12165 [Acidimicrobiales bacterium]|nr:hypothetical protein [Acidimicrobiales bacterium]
MRRRALFLAAVLIVGGACSGGSGLHGVSTDRAPADGPAGVAADVPRPGAVAAEPAPELPARGPAMPTDTISLEELHRQGRTHVQR